MRLGRRPCLRISESGAKTPSTDGDYPVRYFTCNDCGVPCFYPHGLGTVPLGAWERVVHSVGHPLTYLSGRKPPASESAPQRQGLGQVGTWRLLAGPFPWPGELGPALGLAWASQHGETAVLFAGDSADAGPVRSGRACYSARTGDLGPWDSQPEGTVTAGCPGFIVILERCGPQLTTPDHST